jgi:hypothetical protein
MRPMFVCWAGGASYWRHNTGRTLRVYNDVAVLLLGFRERATAEPYGGIVSEGSARGEIIRTDRRFPDSGGFLESLETVNAVKG